MITAKQYAMKYGVHKATVHVWLKQGKVPGAFRKGRNWYIPPDAEIFQEKKDAPERYQQYVAPKALNFNPEGHNNWKNLFLAMKEWRRDRYFGGPTL